jgi:signal transduction histidine kinase
LRADREAEQERRLAVAEERTRIARDLHDSAGHAINVIAVRAGAARLRHDEDPDRSRAALEAIEELARKTVAEIDEIVGTLRDHRSENGEPAAPAGLASLGTLVAQHSAAGLDVTVATSGSPRPLAAAVDVSAYRILQEALTNAARHGTGAADVELAYGDTALQLTISNPLSPNGSPRARGAHGLIGMRERATLLGGRLDSKRTNGAFRLEAELPYRGTGP